MNLDTATKLLQIVLGEAKTTNDCDITTSYFDSVDGGFGLLNNNVRSNGTTPVIAVPAPAANVQRQAKEIRLFNNDTVPHTVTLQLFDGTNTWVIGPGLLTVPVSGAFVYTPEAGALVTGAGSVTSVVAGSNLNVGAGPGGTITGAGTLNIQNSPTFNLGTTGGGTILPVIINANPSGVPTLPIAGTMFEINGNDGLTGRASFYSYNGHGFGWTGVASGGPMSTPSPLLTNGGIMFFAARGYDGTIVSNTQALVGMFAAENWSGTAHGTYLQLSSTPVGTTTELTLISLDGSGQVLIGNGVVASGTLAMHTSGALIDTLNTGTLAAFPLGTGLALSAGSILPNYQGGTLTTFGAGVTLTAGTLTASGSGGTVTQIVAGSNLTGGTITGAGTIALIGTPVIGGLIGSAATLSATGLTSGTGGVVTLIGGTSTTAAVPGGAVTLTGGVPGTGGAGGAVNLNGSAGDAAGANGANVNATGGAGGGTGSGGSVISTAGASGTGASGQGGNARIQGGASLATNGNGGNSNQVGGAGAGTGNGGNAANTGGAGGATSGAGGNASLTGGAGGGTGNGGNVVLTPGAKGASGANGSIQAAGLFRFTSGTPTITAGAGNSITGTDQSGQLTLGATLATAFTVTFGGVYPTAPKSVILTPANATAAATGSTGAYVSAMSASGFTVTGVALASTSYNYLAI